MTKIFMAIFAFDERLLTSATLVESGSLSISSFSHHFLILSPFPHYLSISSLSLHFLFIFSFSLHFLAASLPGCHNMCNPVTDLNRTNIDQNSNKRFTLFNYLVQLLWLLQSREKSWIFQRRKTSFVQSCNTALQVKQ